MQQAHRLMYDQRKIEVEQIRDLVLTNTSAQWVSEPGDEAAIIANSLEEMDMILNMLDPIFDRCHEMEYLHSTVYLRITHRDFHKGSTLSYLANKLSIPKENVFAIGDGENDLGMLDSRYAGMIACPANASSCVKNQVCKHNGYVSNSALVAGTLEALEFYFT